MFRKWTSPESVFRILAKCSKGRPCDISGISDYAEIEAAGGIQWPCAAPAEKGKTPGTTRLFADGKYYTGDARARFVFSDCTPPVESPDAGYPLALLTGRGTSAQWHTGTRTEKSAILRRLYPHSLNVEIHPADASPTKIITGDRVRISSRRGSIIARALVTSAIRQGSVFLPMHYEGTNALTLLTVDPHSRQPSYKYCAVKVEPENQMP